VDPLILREVFQQTSILSLFLSGDGMPEVKTDLMQAIFLAARSHDHSKPDYVYQNSLLATTGTWKTWTDVVDQTLLGLADTFLEEARGRRICARYDRFADWQHLVAEISPLAVICTTLLKRFGPPPRGGALQPVIEYLHDCIIPQIRFSALPTVDDPRIDRVIAQDGLDDLHMHLNGSTEMEVVWLHALLHINAFEGAFHKSEDRREVSDLLTQLEPGLTHEKVVARLRVAQRIHRVLASIVLRELIGDQLSGEWINFSLVQIFSLNGLDLDHMVPITQWLHKDDEHPAKAILGPLDQSPILATEALLLIAAIDAMRRKVHPAIDKLLYVYISLMVQFGRLIVQSRYQFGFDQFQKITLNEVRDSLEKHTFTDRFRQLQSTPEGDLDVLEGRIAPKDSPYDNLSLLRKIDGDYRKHRGQPGPRQFEELAIPARSEDSHRVTIGQMSAQNAPRGNFYERTQAHSDFPVAGMGRTLELRIVVHFIKKKDERDVTACRHYTLRRKIATQQRALRVALKSPAGRKLQVAIAGFDAASNEMHAPPEVFAPVFRTLRHYGATNFTFHVGEDFVHLASGIRAVVEAAEFFDMTPGNRIGHGTAAGVDPKLWRERMGLTTTITQGEWLDNLVLGRAMLAGTGFAHLCPTFEKQISRLSSKIYGDWKPPDLLYRAWELRHLDPLVACGLDGDLEDYLIEMTRTEFKRCNDANTEDPEAFKLFREYHRDKIVERYNEWLFVGSSEWEDPFTPEVLLAMQNYALDVLRRRRLVLETLPTSNVRIHIYNDFREHHLFRWLGLTGEPANIPVVVGTDDPGIFATCIRNEYSHILRELDRLCTAGTHRSEDLLETLIRNGKTWRFRPERLDGGRL
jgi:adenosine deaminase